MNTRKIVQVDQFIDKLPDHTKEIALNLRQLIFEASQEIAEDVKWSVPSYSHNGLVCYISTAKNHVNLGFYRGGDLIDKDNLLEGTGKKMRHIKVKKVDDIQTDKFTSLILEAIKLN